MMGSASGGADVKLETVPEGTRLSYDVDAQVGGKIASLAARFIDPTARMLAGQFFEKLAAIAGSMTAAAAPKAPKKAAAKKPAAKKVTKKPAKAAARKKPAKKPAKRKR
ncbi:MAG: hypothetical protein HC855_06620 [Rhizobiales bacterium]|nr:hypothetical protein [Hyphomicrobiales bacterium]